MKNLSPKSMLPISKPWRAFCKWYQGGILSSILLSLFSQVDDQIDLFISQRDFESILYYLIFVVFLLSIFPSTDVSNPVSHTKLYRYHAQPLFQCCSDAVILLGCVLEAVSAQSTGHSALFDDFSILTLNFWSSSFVRMAAVTIQLGVMKPALKVSPSFPIREIIKYFRQF